MIVVKTYKEGKEMKRMIITAIIAIMMSFSLAAPAGAQEFTINQWVAWFNVQDAYYRCTANVGPPAGFQWGSNCLFIPVY